MSDLTPREKLEALRDSLLAPMPEGFVWDYQDNSTCALELARMLGIEISDISWNAGSRVFLFAGHVLGKEKRDITPTDVADVIDRVLAETPNV